MELERFRVDDRVRPAAFMDLVVMENAEAVEVVLGGRAAVEPVFAVVGVAADGRKLPLTTVVFPLDG